MSNFDTAYERLIGHEGRFTDNPNDNGNWTGGKKNVGVLKGTKFGIAANTYPNIDIKNLTLDQAKEIYKKDWWDEIQADKLPFALVYQLWDFAINSGMGVAVRRLQRVIGVLEDGGIGDITIAAVNKMSLGDILVLLNAERLEYMASLSSWNYFGKGWARRIATNLRYIAKDN